LEDFGRGYPQIEQIISKKIKQELRRLFHSQKAKDPLDPAIPGRFFYCPIFSVTPYIYNTDRQRHGPHQ
jgi:hypothetical protein